MELRINKQKLFNNIGLWDGFLKRKVSLIACGGTALTLLDIKDSTKDIDLIIPKEDEYDYLIKGLESVVGGSFEFCDDPIKTAKLMIAHIDKKRQDLKLKPAMYEAGKA